MRKQIYIGLFTLVLLLLNSCQEEVNHHGKHPIARVANTYLYQEDILPVMPLGLTSSDSTEFIQRFVQQWAKDELLFQKAQKNIPNTKTINDMVEDYHHSLVLQMYQQQLLEQKFSKSITEEQMQAYYNEHPNYFLSKEPLIKGLFMKVPITVSSIKKIRKLIQTQSTESADQLEKISLQKAVDYQYFYDQWLPMRNFIDRMPFDEAKLKWSISHKQNIEKKDTAFYYFLNVSDYLRTNQPQPFDYAKNEIKKILLKTKQVSFMEQTKQELYEKALQDGQVTYYKEKNDE
jgi:hypothetical protein